MMLVSVEDRSQSRSASLGSLQVCFSVLISRTKTALHIRLLIWNTAHIFDFCGMERFRSVAVSSAEIWQITGPPMICN